MANSSGSVEKLARKKLRQLEAEESPSAWDLSSAWTDLGEALKRASPDEAAAAYTKALKFAAESRNFLDWTLAHRNLGELHIQRDEPKKALHHFYAQLDVAKQSKVADYVQLAHHTLASNLLDEAAAAKFRGDADREKEFLVKALQHARICLNLLNNSQADIEENVRKTKVGESIARRKAGINCVLGRLYFLLGYANDSRKHFRLVQKYVDEHQCKKKEAAFYTTYMDNLVDTLRSEEKLVALEELIPLKKSLKQDVQQNEIALRMQQLTCGRDRDTKLAVISYFLSRHKKSKREGELKVFTFLYLFIRIDSRVAAARTDRDKCSLYEEVADAAVDAGFEELAIEFYERMAKHAKISGSKRKEYAAYASIYETLTCTFFDFKQATEFKRKCVQLVSAAYPKNEEKSFLNNFDLFLCECKQNLDETSRGQQHDHFMQLKAVSEGKRKADVLAEFVLFLAYHSRDPHELRTRQKELQALRLELEDANDENDRTVDSDHEDEAEEVDIDEMVDELTSFCTNIRVEASQKDVHEKNSHGEYALHTAAKENNPQQLEQLLQNGHRVHINALDNAGWTPLMEAANRGLFANVRILIAKGANVNIASTGGLVDEDGREGPTKITALMDALAGGHLQVAKLLVQAKASLTAENSRGETALDMLREFIATCAEGDKKEDARKFLRLLEHTLAKRPRFS